jgi:DNA-binding Lrp family transcriptional regulator
METNDNQNGSKRKPSPFTVMNNIRDRCKQSDAKKLLMMILGTYSNGDGLCFPGNRALADAMNKSERTVKRMLKELKADGELEILRPGVGRDQKRIIRLKRYVAKPATAMTPKGDKAMTPLNGTRSLGKTARNSQYEQPVLKKNMIKVRYTHGLRATADSDLVFERKDKALQGKNKLQDNFGVLDSGKKGGGNFLSRNGARKTIPMPQRNKMINKLNERKRAIYRSHPAGLTAELQREVEEITDTLQKL